MNQLQDLSQEELIQEVEHLQRLINNLATKNAQLTVTVSSLEVSNEQLMQNLKDSNSNE